MPHTKTKVVAVTVDDTGHVTTTPNPVKVRNQNVLLAFQLLTPGYAFPDSEAIVVSDGGEQFPFPSWTLSGSTAALLDANSAAGDFAYTVSVVELATGKALRIDPSIQNETK